MKALQNGLESFALVQCLVCFDKQLEAHLGLPQSQPASAKKVVLDICCMNFLALKQWKGEKVAYLTLAQARLQSVMMEVQLGPNSPEKEEATVRCSVKDWVVMDYTQQHYKIYNKLLNQQSQTMKREGLSNSFFVDREINQESTMRWLCSATVPELIAKHERNVILCKHSSCLEAQAGQKLLDLTVAVSFDKSRKFEFTKRAFVEMWRQASALEVNKAKQISALYGLINDLQADPMDLKVEATLKDIMLRAQPLLSQKADEKKELWEELQSSRFFFQLNQDKTKLKQLMCEQTCLQKEVSQAAAALKRAMPVQAPVLSCKDFRPDAVKKEAISLSCSMVGLALDIHPVVSFKDYLAIFGRELKKKMDFLTFNEYLKFRVSQRLVVYLADCSAGLNLQDDQGHTQKQLKATVKGLSVNVLDQSLSTEELLNPLALVPGLKAQGEDSEIVERPPLRLNEPTPGISIVSYLSSLGFSQVFLLDYSDLSIDATDIDYIDASKKKFEQVKVQANSKKVLIYLTRDSIAALQYVLEGLQANARAAGFEEAKPERSQHLVGSQLHHHSIAPRIEQPQPREQIKPPDNNLSYIFDSLMKDYNLNRTRVEESTESFLSDCHIEEEKFEPLLRQGRGVGQDNECLFVIDQINDSNMRRKGCASVPMDELIKDDYIKPVKKQAVRQALREKASHALPVIQAPQKEDILAPGFGENLQFLPKGTAIEDEPYKYLQPRFQVQVFFQAIDVKLFQGLDFDFVPHSGDPGN